MDVCYHHFRHTEWTIQTPDSKLIRIKLKVVVPDIFWMVNIFNSIFFNCTLFPRLIGQTELKILAYVLFDSLTWIQVSMSVHVYTDICFLCTWKTESIALSSKRLYQQCSENVCLMIENNYLKTVLELMNILLRKYLRNNSLEQDRSEQIIKRLVLANWANWTGTDY